MSDVLEEAMRVRLLALQWPLEVVRHVAGGVVYRVPAGAPPELEALAGEFLYRGPAHFVLEHGTFARGSELPLGCRTGAPNHCFWNALTYSLETGAPYVEGYACSPQLTDHASVPGGVVPHAWNLGPRGEVRDLTLAWQIEPAWTFYYGVPFSAARAHDASWHGDAHVLGDANRGMTILRERWQGEESPGDLTGLLSRIVADMRAWPDPRQHRAADLLEAGASGWVAT